MCETPGMADKETRASKASDRIRQAIEDAVKDGSLLPGDPIDEAALADFHEVSRTPVREALIQLQAQGLVSSLPRGGVIVAQMNLQQLLALWELLAELEGVAVRLACQRMTGEELQQIVHHHEASAAIVEAEDVAGWQESNLAFHELIYRATRNPYLRQEVLRIRTRTGYYRRHAFGALGRIRVSHEQHREVVNALQQGDAQAAAQAMLAHMRPEQSPSGLTDLIANLPEAVFLSRE